MLTKTDISEIVAKYGPSIAERYYTLKKTPVRMLSNAFLTFADHDRMNSSVAFIDISADRSGYCGFIFCKAGIHYGLESSKGFIDFSEVSDCAEEYPDDTKNEYRAVLIVNCGNTRHILDGRFAKAPLKHIIEEARALYIVRNAESAEENAAVQALSDKGVEIRSEGGALSDNGAALAVDAADEAAVWDDKLDNEKAIRSVNEAPEDLPATDENNSAESAPINEHTDSLFKDEIAVVSPSHEAPQSEYVRKPTSEIKSEADEKRAAHFNEIRKKAQRETAEIEEIKRGKAPLEKECRAPVKPKPNPAPFGYTETIIAEMTISSNDITDIYMQDVIATTPNPDIYARSAEVIGNCMKDQTLTDERITAYLRENLAHVTDAFLTAVQQHKSELPPRTLHSVEVLDRAAKSMDKYIKQGEENARRVMLFMCFQMMTYTDNMIQSEATKAVCLNFIKTFGTLGLILSMLDLELY